MNDSSLKHSKLMLQILAIHLITSKAGTYRKSWELPKAINYIGATVVPEIPTPSSVYWAQHSTLSKKYLIFHIRANMGTKDYS